MINLGVVSWYEDEPGVWMLTFACGCPVRAQQWGWCWRVGRPLVLCQTHADAVRAYYQARYEEWKKDAPECAAGRHAWDMRLAFKQCRRCLTKEEA